MSELSGLALGLPAPFDPLDRHALHLFTVLVDEERAGISGRLPRRDDRRGHWRRRPLPVDPGAPLLPGAVRLAARDWPHAANRRQTVSLPLSARPTDEDVSDVIEAVRRTASV